MSHEAPIYLDYAATTPLDPRVRDFLVALLSDPARIGNPSSPHAAGRRARALMDTGRAAVASLISAAPRDIVFTSGATEADNLAIRGAAHLRAHRGRHVVTMTTEHKAVLEAFDVLESEGFEVTRLSPGPDGRLDTDTLVAALRDDTQLVSVMHVNNETGVIQDIETIGENCRERDILFHTDAAQSAGKLPIDVSRMPIDLMSLSAHKMYGPQGIGAVYVADRPGCGLKSLLVGGSQERGRRAGTEPVALIAAFGRAAELASSEAAADLAQMTRLRDRLLDALDGLPGLRRNGSSTHHYPGILNLACRGIDGESLMLALEPLCVATGSACNARSGEASFVLRALGLPDRDAQSAIRFSFGRQTSEDDIDRAAVIYRSAVERLRRVAGELAAA